MDKAIAIFGNAILMMLSYTFYARHAMCGDIKGCSLWIAPMALFFTAIVMITVFAIRDNRKSKGNK